MRIYKNRLYIRENVPGISGFQRWNEREYRITTGHNTLHRSEIIAEFKPNGKGRYALEDGHVEGYQPLTDESGMMAWVRENRFQAARILNPEVYGLMSKIRAS